MTDTRAYIGLLHYPILGKDGNIIGTSITNLDIHDLSRTAMTYGIEKVFMITPFDLQEELLNKIINHWTIGTGAKQNPLRAKALSLVKVKKNIDEVIENIQSADGSMPLTIATAARNIEGNISFKSAREMIRETPRPVFILFGTGWGMTEEIITKADIILEPITGNTDYNHLSVRAASAIIIDRLLGKA
ncbi:MAG: RNA methyltransferase [Candidatus Schekmanbacteria bacterium]|nr:RNA methyltransferase [Candidatus Schekmanbacteria bacterium]